MENQYQLQRMENKKVLIIGGLGAIGSNIAHTTISLGAEVTIFDNMMKSAGANLANIKEIKDKIKFIKGDLRNYKDVKTAIMGKDIIYNCAAQVSHTLSMQDPYLDIDINCKGNINLLECCRKYNPSVKIIHTGSRSQFGKQKKLPITEDSLDFPPDIFSANKLAAELYGEIYHKIYGLATTTLRLTNIYGPRGQANNPGYSIVNWFIGKAVLNEDLTVFEPGTQLRDLVYMQDAVDAIILASQNHKAEGKTFIVGSGLGISLVELSKMIVTISNKGNVKLIPWSSQRKSIEPGDVILDYSKIKNELGWYPKTSIQEGIKKTIDFYKDKKEDYF